MMNKREIEMVETFEKAYPVEGWSYDKEKQFKNEAGRVVSNTVNCFGLGTREIAEALHSSREASHNMDCLSGCWLKVLEAQYASHMYDDRNRYSVEIGKNLSMNAGIMELSSQQADGYTPFDERGRFGKTYSFGMYMADHMSREHRTLQQSFSGIVFHYLKMRFPGLDMGDGSLHWERCPMI